MVIIHFPEDDVEEQEFEEQEDIVEKEILEDEKQIEKTKFEDDIADAKPSDVIMLDEVPEPMPKDNPIDNPIFGTEEEGIPVDREVCNKIIKVSEQTVQRLKALKTYKVEPHGDVVRRLCEYYDAQLQSMRQ